MENLKSFFVGLLALLFLLAVGKKISTLILITVIIFGVITLVGWGIRVIYSIFTDGKII